jgi:6-phosphogluconate dehydrogenase
MSAALDVRCLSALKDDRVAASRILTGPTTMPAVDRSQLVDDVRQALYAAKICSYAQVRGAYCILAWPRGASVARVSASVSVSVSVSVAGAVSGVTCSWWTVVLLSSQGMNLIREAASQLGWSVNLGECARIWKGGCIIRAKFLDRCVPRRHACAVQPL